MQACCSQEYKPATWHMSVSGGDQVSGTLLPHLSLTGSPVLDTTTRSCHVKLALTREHWDTQGGGAEERIILTTVNTLLPGEGG